MVNLVAIILAAGQGTRIGGPKWRLKIGDETFLETIANTLQKAVIETIICVARQESLPPLAMLRANYIQLVINNTPESGMFSSIYAGIQAIDALGYLIIPVDYPYVTSSTIGKLKAAFLVNPKAIIYPSYQKHSGYPIILPNKVAALIANQDPPYTLCDFLVKQEGVPSLVVTVNDPGILKNINTKEDLYKADD